MFSGQRFAILAMFWSLLSQLSLLSLMLQRFCWEVAWFFWWRRFAIFFWEVVWFCVWRGCVWRVCVIFLTQSLRLHDLFFWRLPDLFFAGRLPDFFGVIFLWRACMIFLWRGCMIFFVDRLRDFICLDVAWFCIWRGCVICLTHSLRLHDLFF